uniref:Uncharacterized protein n=1 Tax=Arundo donax TaxID=35708 RepID=A0A0A9CRY4_ARUDO
MNACQSNSWLRLVRDATRFCLRRSFQGCKTKSNKSIRIRCWLPQKKKQ